MRRTARRNIGAWAVPELLERIKRRFGYLFSARDDLEAGGLYRPILDGRPIEGPFRVGGLDVVPFEQDHGICATTGFRFGRFR